MEHQLIFFGYGSADNTNCQYYINKIERTWNDLYEKNQKELEKNIQNELNRCKNKPQQADTGRIQLEHDKKFELELDLKVQKEFQKMMDNCHIDGLVIYMLRNGYKIEASLVENTINSIKEELLFLKNNNHSVIMNQNIFWNDINRRTEYLDVEIKFLEKIIQSKII